MIFKRDVHNIKIYPFILLELAPLLTDCTALPFAERMQSRTQCGCGLPLGNLPHAFASGKYVVIRDRELNCLFVYLQMVVIPSSIAIVSLSAMIK